MYVRILEGAEEKARMRVDWKAGDVLVMSDATGQKYLEAGAVEQLSREEYLEAMGLAPEDAEAT